jgi:hypothetical protein
MKIGQLVQKLNGERNSCACYLLHVGFLLVLFFDPEGGGEMLLRIIC